MNIPLLELAALALVCIDASPRTKMVARIVGFSNCEESSDIKSGRTGLYVTNVTIVHLTRDQSVINSEIVATRFIPSDIKSRVTVYRCESRDSRRCESFLSFVYYDVCRKLRDKNQPWSPFISNTTPLIQCPLEKNVYHMRNASLDTNVIMQLAKKVPQVTNYFWRLDIELMNKTQSIGCLSALAKLDNQKL